MHFKNLECSFGDDVAVQHLGDNTVGGGVGETIVVSLDLLPICIERLAFVVNIYDASGDFSEVQNAYVVLKTVSFPHLLLAVRPGSQPFVAFLDDRYS